MTTYQTTRQRKNITKKFHMERIELLDKSFDDDGTFESIGDLSSKILNNLIGKCGKKF